MANINAGSGSAAAVARARRTRHQYLPRNLGVIPVTAINITSAGGATTLAVGSTLQLTANLTPSDATHQTGTWSIDNTARATINASTGLVTGVAAGAVVATYTHADGMTATFNITVS